MATTSDTTRCIDVCNDLLRGELSAIETYSSAINKYADEAEVAILKSIREEHIESANQLRQNVKSMGGEPDRDSGAWGGLTKTIQATANLLGEGSAISSLKQGEEIGRAMYEKALENDDVLDDCKEMIRSSLLPRVCNHIVHLDSL